MKYLIFLLFLPNIAHSQWREIKIASSTDVGAIQENFRRASLYSSRKLDKFSNDTVYADLTFKGGVTISSTTNAAILAGTQTFTGSNTFNQTGAGVTSISSATISYLNLTGDMRSNYSDISVSSQPLGHVTLATGNTLRVINTLPALTTYGEPVLVAWRFVCRPSGGDAYIHIELVRNGTTQITPTGARGILALSGYDTNISGVYLDKPLAGNNTYSLQGYGDNNIAVICSGGTNESWAQFSATRLH